MIVAIEGASAAGKTTWCRRHFPGRHVPETPSTIAAPDLSTDPTEIGLFWVNHAIENWQRALALEREHRIAVCDGDPFHLYYSWALWKTGVLNCELFEIESALYRTAFDQQQVGFVDHVLWLEVPMDELRRRAQADSTRRRKRHEMYLTLVPWMKMWFGARESLLPGTTHALCDDVRIEELRPEVNRRRYDSQVVAQMLSALSVGAPSEGCHPYGNRMTID